jgi:5'-3' exonuclease
MNNNKFSIIFDGNYFFFKTLYVIPRTKKIQLENDEDVAIYIRKLSTDFASVIKKFKDITDQLVFVVDSKSWRKDYYPEIEYKGNRKSDDSINWDNFSKSMDIFCNILEKHGVIIHRISGAEGDDLCYLWSTYSNNKGKNCIIFSGDTDLMQLVDFNKSTDAITLFYTSAHNKLVTYSGFLEFLKSPDKEVDIFNLSKVTNSEKVKKIFNKLKTDENLEIIELNPSEYIFTKILMGDRGDNIKSIYYYTKTIKGGKQRTYGIGEKKAQLILKEFKDNYGEFNLLYLFNEQDRNNILNITIRLMKADKMSKEEISENFIRNIYLILLHNKTLPENLQETAYSKIEEDYENLVNINKFTSSDTLLENTEYIDSTKNFDNTKSNTDYSFIKDKKDGNNSKSLF